MSVLDLPPMPATADPVILPGLLSGLGITRRPIPAWVTDPDLIASIETGLIDIDDDFMGEHPMTALDAYETARILADHGLTSDAATTADIDTAADHTGSPRPTTPDDRHTVRLALDAIGDAR